MRMLSHRMIRRTSFPVLYYCCYASSSRAAAFRTMTSTSKPTAVAASSSSALSAAVDSRLGQTLVSIPDGISLHGQPNVKFLDGTWWLDKTRSGRSEFQEGPRIARAGYLDIDDISTEYPEEKLPHMMPSQGLQSAAMDALGISLEDHVVVYGRQDCMFVTRAYYQLRTMGHPRECCHLLDGSLEEWMAAGGPVEDEGSPPSQPLIEAASLSPTTTDSNYQATDAQRIVTYDELLEWIQTQQTLPNGDDEDAAPEILVVDARSHGRFTGVEPEPRPGLRGGRMPGAVNLPIVDLLDPSNKVRLKPPDELRQRLTAAGILGKRPRKIVSTCGSGVTACAMLTALDVLEEDSSHVYLFDGSWVQWGGRSDSPIVK